jgi:dipeptidase
MRFKRLIPSIINVFMIFILLIPFGINSFADCTDIIVGKKATVDGSVINSHTGACSDSRVHVVPARTYKKGTMAPVYWGMVFFGRDDERAGLPVGNYGEVIGEIPQVEKTYAYFHTGYSQFNEHQLAIGESTLSQKNELKTYYVEGISQQIMTIEQAQVFALERCKTAKEAIELITSLVEKYGFLPSCEGGAEALTITDTKEAWVLEVFSVGPEWTQESGKLGALWAAQRVPDDHATIVPNYSRIREIRIDSPDFLASENYKQVAIDKGWYDPASGASFIWQEAYAPPIGEGSLNRVWLFFSTISPNLKEWPRRKLVNPTDSRTLYRQRFEGAAFYPFSAKPEKKLSVQDIITFQRSVFEDTIYDMTLNSAWLVPDGKGGYVKSPLTTPFPSKELEDLLGISHHRNVSQAGYGFVSQARSWLPDPIGGVYWFYLDNQYMTTYVPIYAGVQEISPLYKTRDLAKFDENSAQWVIDFVDNLLHLKWQEAIKDLQAVRDPLEAEFFASQSDIETQALDLHKKDPELAKEYLTKLTRSRMEKIVQMYRDLRYLLITKFTNSTE